MRHEARHWAGAELTADQGRAPQRPPGRRGDRVTKTTGRPDCERDGALPATTNVAPTARLRRATRQEVRHPAGADRRPSNGGPAVGVGVGLARTWQRPPGRPGDRMTKTPDDWTSGVRTEQHPPGDHERRTYGLPSGDATGNTSLGGPALALGLKNRRPGARSVQYASAGESHPARIFAFCASNSAWVRMPAALSSPSFFNWSSGSAAGGAAAYCGCGAAYCGCAAYCGWGGGWLYWGSGSGAACWFLSGPPIGLAS